MQVSIGRIVHVYDTNLHECTAAMVTTLPRDSGLTRVGAVLFGQTAQPVTATWIDVWSEGVKWHDPRVCPNLERALP